MHEVSEPRYQGGGQVSQAGVQAPVLRLREVHIHLAAPALHEGCDGPAQGETARRGGTLRLKIQTTITTPRSNFVLLSR